MMSKKTEKAFRRRRFSLHESSSARCCPPLFCQQPMRSYKKRQNRCTVLAPMSIEGDFHVAREKPLGNNNWVSVSLVVGSRSPGLFVLTEFLFEFCPASCWSYLAQKCFVDCIGCLQLIEPVRFRFRQCYVYRFFCKCQFFGTLFAIAFKHGGTHLRPG